MAAMPHRIALRLLSGLFALFTVAELLQLAQAARGEHPDPPGILLVHALSGILAVLAAVGLWRGRGWAPVAVLSWGVVMATMLMVLGPALDEPRESWRALQVAAAVVAVFSVGACWYVWRHGPGQQARY
jgi:hypothetical protein